MPNVTSKQPKREERNEIYSSSQPSEETNLANILIWDSLSLELWDNQFLLFKPSSLYYFVTIVLEN